ncbi:MAG: carboxypeptidase regulatory-like domain-containing protein [Acidobacteriaceae bacterium]|nr:carboxypeptidase regulatory-like domain-containing protein [Acidobacteriaceae bacterium]
MLPIRLCSLDRVVETVGDEWGAFAFFLVPPGTYDLVTGGGLWNPVIIKGVEVKGDKPTELTVDVNAFQASPCSRDTTNDCQAVTYAVEYGPRSVRKQAAIEGKAIDRDLWGGVLWGASIRVFRQGETTPLYNLKSNSKGRFQLNLEPGIYRLKMTRNGSQDVVIPDFLVPLENVTKIVMYTARPGAIVVCR